MDLAYIYFMVHDCDESELKEMNIKTKLKIVLYRFGLLHSCPFDSGKLLSHGFDGLVYQTCENVGCEFNE